MSAQVTHFLTDDSPHLLRHDARSPSSSSSSSSHKMFEASLTVRPPSRAQAGVVMTPPTVVQISDKNWVNAMEMRFLAHAALLEGGEDGRVLEDDGLFMGTKAAVGVFVDPHTAVFAFPDLAIRDAGRYTIRIDVYRQDDVGASFLEHLWTPPISVYNGNVPIERPCKYRFRQPHDLFCHSVIFWFLIVPPGQEWQNHVGLTMT